MTKRDRPEALDTARCAVSDRHEDRAASQLEPHGAACGPMPRATLFFRALDSQEGAPELLAAYRWRDPRGAHNLADRSRGHRCLTRQRSSGVRTTPKCDSCRSRAIADSQASGDSSRGAFTPMPRFKDDLSRKSSPEPMPNNPYTSDTTTGATSSHAHAGLSVFQTGLGGVVRGLGVRYRLRVRVGGEVLLRRLQISCGVVRRGGGALQIDLGTSAPRAWRRAESALAWAVCSFGAWANSASEASR